MALSGRTMPISVKRPAYRPSASRAVALSIAAIVVAFAGSAAAYDGRMVVAQSAPNSAAKKSSAAPTAGKAAAAPAATAGGDAGLRQRVEQLEEQLVDLQVVIGTLESLARTTGPSSSSTSYQTGGAAVTSDGPRLDQLETQLRALVQQVEQLNDRVRASEGQPRVASQPPAAPPVQRAQPSASGGFGQITVTPGSATPPSVRESDSIGQLLGQSEQQPPAGSGPPGAALGRQGAPVEQAALGSPAARQLYDTAYNHLLQQDYGAAEYAFSDFLARHPNDALAGNAQYWLGETHFARGQFRAAAQAFLKGYQNFSRSQKAPDSLLKLAMSLDRLGQRDAACSSFNELSSRFPTAPAQTRSRALAERQRLGCP